jgi:hypothetical protein
MWGWMGWFITFNFVNVAWVFFRAKDFASVEKVLGGMFGTGGIVLPRMLAGKLAFLSHYHVEFMSSTWLSNAGLSGIFDLSILIGMVFFVLVMKNSHELTTIVRLNKITASLIALVLFISFISIGAESEFLYFNF